MVVNHSPTDDAQMVNIGPQDPIIEGPMEENSIIGSKASHLEDDDRGDVDLPL